MKKPIDTLFFYTVISISLCLVLIFILKPLSYNYILYYIISFLFIMLLLEIFGLVLGKNIKTIRSIILCIYAIMIWAKLSSLFYGDLLIQYNI